MSMILGLTGPTGAGKSTVALLLAGYGAAIVDADLQARRIMEPGGDCLLLLQEAFGTQILLPDGSLDRKQLGERVFSDREALLTLNRITTPFIMERIKQEIQDARKGGAALVVLDAPTLFETGADRLCDVTAAVIAPHALRRKRIVERDGLTEEQAENRIRSQQPDLFYEQRAGFLLRNEAQPQQLERQAADLYRKLVQNQEKGALPCKEPADRRGVEKDI